MLGSIVGVWHALVLVHIHCSIDITSAVLLVWILVGTSSTAYSSKNVVKLLLVSLLLSWILLIIRANTHHMHLGIRWTLAIYVLVHASSLVLPIGVLGALHQLVLVVTHHHLLLLPSRERGQVIRVDGSHNCGSCSIPTYLPSLTAVTAHVRHVIYFLVLAIHRLLGHMVSTFHLLLHVVACAHIICWRGCLSKRLIHLLHLTRVSTRSAAHSSVLMRELLLKELLRNVSIGAISTELSLPVLRLGTIISAVHIDLAVLALEIVTSLFILASLLLVLLSQSI